MKNISFKSAIYLILSISILSIASCVEDGEIDSIAYISSTQSGLTVSEYDCHFEFNGGTKSIGIYTENSWTASASADWITVSPENGAGNNSLTIKVTNNPSLTERSGYITITPDGFNPVKISVSQDPSEASVATGTSNGYEYVDLGLSVMWATCNIGASNPEDYGDYYAWGETSVKSSYSWENYCFYISGYWYDNVKFSKYNTQSDRGTVDNRTTLDLSDDVARQKWGGNWRMPTITEFQELIDNCTWTWTAMNGLNGYKVTSRKSGYTDRSIFLPAAGFFGDSTPVDAGTYGEYWSSSLNTDSPGHAWKLYSNSVQHTTSSYGSRDYGHPVRPVFSSTQSGLTVSEYDCHFDCNGGTKSISIYTKNSWTASANSDWITVSPKNGTGENSLTITVANNPSSTERSGYVTITLDGFSPVKITVSQDSSETFDAILGTWKMIGEEYHPAIATFKSNGEYVWEWGGITGLKDNGTYTYKDGVITMTMKERWERDMDWVDGERVFGEWQKMTEISPEDPTTRVCTVYTAQESFLVWKFGGDYLYMSDNEWGVMFMLNDKYQKPDIQVDEKLLDGEWIAKHNDGSVLGRIIIKGRNITGYFSYGGINIKENVQSEYTYVLTSTKTTGTFRFDRGFFIINATTIQESYEYKGYDRETGNGIYEYSTVDPNTLEAERWIVTNQVDHTEQDLIYIYGDNMFFQPQGVSSATVYEKKRPD